MHQIQILGNVTKKLELQISEKGTKYTTFSIASNITEGNKKIVTYFECIAFGNTAKYLVKYLKDCGKINIYGICKNSKYTTQTGTKKEKIIVKINEVTIIDYKSLEKTSNNNELLEEIEKIENQFLNEKETINYNWTE